MSFLRVSFLTIILLLSGSVGCGALRAIHENNVDHNAFLMKYRPADMMVDPRSPIHIFRGIAAQFPSYYQPPVCDAAGCFVLP